MIENTMRFLSYWRQWLAHDTSQCYWIYADTPFHCLHATTCLLFKFRNTRCGGLFYVMPCIPMCV